MLLLKGTPGVFSHREMKETATSAAMSKSLGMENCN